MESVWDYRLVLTDEERSTLNKAIELLRPFNTQTVSYYTAYFEEVDEDGDCVEDLGSEYDCCDDDTCISEMLQKVKLEYPGININHRLTDNSCDHERIDRCQVCDKPLNEWLTYIRSEFDHYNEHKPSFSDIQDQDNSNAAFDLISIFQSFPSNDEVVSQYELHQKMIGNKEPFDRKMKSIEDFKNSVIGLSNHVINVLEINKGK